MTPTLPNSKDTKHKLSKLLSDFGEIRMPEESEPPILAPSTRNAVIEWMRELEAGDELKANNIPIRRRALFDGPPGTGKTTLAHHLSARLGLPMLLVGSENLIDSGLGQSGKNIANFFNTLAVLTKEKIFLTIFFDEIDSIAMKRSGDSSCATERATTLNVLLRKIEKDRNIVFGATNRPDILDPALWRRFDMQINVGLPQDAERYAILKRYSLPLDVPESDLHLISEHTEGASPDLLKKLMESIKRSLILWPKMGRDTSNAEDVFKSFLITSRPPPELEANGPILLWSEPEALTTLCTELTWPWTS